MDALKESRMKTLMIVVGVMTIMTMAHGFNVARSQQFSDNYKECTRELGGSIYQPRTETIKCALAKDSRIINADGRYIREEGLKLFEDIISDPSDVEKAKSILNSCYDSAIQSGGTTDRQTTKIVDCTLPILLLLDKLI